MNVPKPRFYDSFVNLLAGLGVPGRDKFMSQQYTYVPMSQHECEIAYRSDWIAKKVVDIPAWDMTRQWRAWQADKDQIQAIEDVEKALFVQQKVQQAIIKARLYGGAILIIGVEQGDPSLELDLEQVGQDSLKFLHVIPQHRITVGPLILDVMSPYYGMPEYYEAQSQPGLTAPTLTTTAPASKSEPSDPTVPAALSSTARGSNQWQVRLHPSRVVRFFGLVPPDPIQNAAIGGWGDSALQPVNDAIKASGMVTGSLATMISEMKVDVIKIPQLTDVLSTDEGTRKMISRFSNANVAKSVVNTLLLDGDEDWQRIETSLRGVPEVLEVYLMIAAGAADVPATRFLGRSPQGLNATGESDIRNYYDRLASEQSLTLTPAMNKLDEVIIRSALGDRPEEIFYEWNSLWQATATEKAAIALQKGQNYQIDVAAALIPTTALAHGRINQLIEDGVYPGLEQEIAKAELEGDTVEEHNAPAPVVPQGVDPMTGKPLPPVDAKTGKAVKVPPGGNGAAPPPFGGKKAPPFGAKATDSEFDDDDCAACVVDVTNEKETQDDVNYRAGKGDTRCANCAYFQAPSSCSEVESPISGPMLCDLFEAADTQDEEAVDDDGPFDDDKATPCHQPSGQSTGGQFVSCGTGGGSGRDPGDHPGPGYSRNAKVNADGVIETTKVEDAQRALFENRKVELDQPDKVATLIKKLGKETRDMVEKGKDAPNYNLCNVSVKGTNLFCGGSKGIPRVEMPQLDTDQTKAFLKSLKKEGFKVEKDRMEASHMKATQNELSGVKVWMQATKAKSDPSRLEKRLVVSKDGYILDGHHHWGAKIALDAKDNKLTGKMRVSRVDATMTQLLSRAKKFSGPSKSVSEGKAQIEKFVKSLSRKKKDGTTISDGIFDLDDHYDDRGNFYLDADDINDWSEEDHPRDPQGEFTSGGGGGSAGETKPVGETVPTAKSQPLGSKGNPFPVSSPHHAAYEKKLAELTASNPDLTPAQAEQIAKHSVEKEHGKLPKEQKEAASRTGGGGGKGGGSGKSSGTQSKQPTAQSHRTAARSMGGGGSGRSSGGGGGQSSPSAKTKTKAKTHTYHWKAPKILKKKKTKEEKQAASKTTPTVRAK